MQYVQSGTGRRERRHLNGSFTEARLTSTHRDVIGEAGVGEKSSLWLWDSVGRALKSVSRQSPGGRCKRRVQPGHEGLKTNSDCGPRLSGSYCPGVLFGFSRCLGCSSRMCSCVDGALFLLLEFAATTKSDVSRFSIPGAAGSQ